MSMTKATKNKSHQNKHLSPTMDIILKKYHSETKKNQKIIKIFNQLSRLRGVSLTF